jgi:hypothetical protein
MNSSWSSVLRRQACKGVIVSLATALLHVVPVVGQVRDTNHWDLGVITTDADLSPDDRLIAITSVSPTGPQEAAQIVESLEVWDYRQHHKIVSANLATQVRTEHGENPVRFTADGLLLAAADSTKVHVFEVASLGSIRLIQPPLPPDFRTVPWNHLRLGTSRSSSHEEKRG